MAVNYTIQAEIIDITQDHPILEDKFMVDTNVWYWMYYTNASIAGKPYQVKDYPHYINKVLNANAKIFYSGLSFAELAHLIEKTEHEIFQQTHPTNFRLKEYRHNYPQERQQVAAEIEAVFKAISAMAASITATIDNAMINTAIQKISSKTIDVYDLFILNSMQLHEIKQIITADGDFATISGIQVFTANNTVIQAAKMQGKLIVR